MCTGSNHFNKRRNAKVGDKLVVAEIPGHFQHRGMVSPDDMEKLVCLRGSKEVTIPQIRFVDVSCVPTVGQKFNNKRNVTLRFDGGDDWFLDKDGLYVFHLSHLKLGVRINYGVVAKKRVITGKPGVAAVEKAIKEAIATTPKKRAKV